MIKKITKFILIFLFLFTNNSYSGVKETGSGPIEERILNRLNEFIDFEVSKIDLRLLKTFGTLFFIIDVGL